MLVPTLEDIPSMVQGTDDTATTSESGTPLHENVLIPEAYASSQPAPPDVTDEPYGTVNVLPSAVFTGTSVPSGETGLLEGKARFLFAFPPALTLQHRYFPRILSASPLQ